MAISSILNSANPLFSSSALQRLTAQPDESKSAEKTARNEFLDYTRKTPAERMHAAMLAKRGLTEEQFAAMSPDERRKIEEEIKREIKERAEAGNAPEKGLIADLRV